MRKIIIPQNVINIGILEFHNFSLLQEFIIPKSSTSIKDKEFYKCKSLVKVEIPPSVTNIGEYAFYECVSLKNITIPSSVKTIGFNAFNKCSSLKNIKISPLPKNFDVYTFSICTSFMQNFQIPSFHIDKDTIILDGTYHDVELPSSIENTKFKKIKLMVVGESCVGKTRYITKYINENDEFSFITKMFQESIKVDFNISGKSILLDILDTPGFEAFKSIYERFYSNINCAIFMFDLTDIETLKPFQYCFEHLYSVFGQIPIVLVGNKCDLEDKKISTEEINEIINQYDVKFFEVSVKNNLNIRESMNYTVGEAFRKIYFDNAELLKASEKEKSVENKCNIS